MKHFQLFQLFAILILISSITFGQTTWYQIPTGTNQKLNAIHFPTPNVGYIVGDNHTILKSVDAGLTWQNFSGSGVNNVVDVKFLDENVGFIAEEGGIWRTTDGCQSWEPYAQISMEMCYYQAVFPFSESNFFVGGSVCPGGATIRNYDNGSWTTGNLTMNFPDFNQYVTDISFVSPTVGLAATRSEFMLRTVDGGVIWVAISTGISDSLTSVIMVNDTLCYAGYEDSASQGFGILKSEDGGLTWTQDINSATFYYPSYLTVAAANNGDIYSGGFSTNTSGGLIFESEDGTNWQYYTVDQPINDMSSYGSDITFGVGDSGYLVVNTPLDFLGASEINELKFEMFPNPVSHVLTIVNPFVVKGEVHIYDVTGSEVVAVSVQNGANTIDVAFLSSGIYSVSVKIGNKTQIEKLVIQ